MIFKIDFNYAKIFCPKFTLLAAILKSHAFVFSPLIGKGHQISTAQLVCKANTPKWPKIQIYCSFCTIVIRHVCHHFFRIKSILQVQFCTYNCFYNLRKEFLKFHTKLNMYHLCDDMLIWIYFLKYNSIVGSLVECSTAERGRPGFDSRVMQFMSSFLRTTTTERWKKSMIVLPFGKGRVYSLGGKQV